MEDQVPSDENQDNSLDTINAQTARSKMKSERSKKKSRKSDRSPSKKTGKKKRGRRKENKRKSNVDKYEETRRLEEYDRAREMSMAGMEGKLLKKEEDKLRYLESVRPKRDMDEDLIQRIMAMSTVGNDRFVFDQMMDDLNEKKRDASRQPEDVNKYQLGKNIYHGRDVYNVPTMFKSMEEKLNIYMEKNLEAFKEIHRNIFEHLKKIGKRENEYSDEYTDDELIKQEILKDLIEPWGSYIADTPYYYGTKDLRPGYSENDAKKYETMGRDFMETMAIAYGNDLEKVPELLPLTEEDLLMEGVDPEYLHVHNYDDKKKKELEDYYFDAYDQKVLFERYVDQGGIFRSDWEGIEELLKDINDYYDGPTISGCVKLKQNMYDRVSKQLNRVGLFGERHLAYCSDNILLTEVYLREFEKLPREFILGPHSNFENLFGGNYGTGEYFGHIIYRYFPVCLYEEMRTILHSMGLYVHRANFNFVSPFGDYGKQFINITPTNSLYLLAMVFKTMEPDYDMFLHYQDLFGLNMDRDWNDIDVMINSGNGQSGIEKLRIFLDKLGTSYNEIKEGREIRDIHGNLVHTYFPDIFGDNIEITKRFFILLMIGLVDTSRDYGDKLDMLENRIYNEASRAGGTFRMSERGNLEYHSEVPIKSRIGATQKAKNENILVEGKWKLQLCRDMRELHNYFTSKLI